ncbi:MULTISPECIES: hypothetical protein [Microbacterium]|uniref:hypothetical protein n=1 Tax=Microbacterium TaxID=33882 RepID=UPI000D939FFB|nr:MULTISPECIES: hypothetical protein [Microbacterium]QYG12026.1 hypothetical protein KY497_01475 [Microbacterium sp. PAMC22086]
MAAGVDRRSAAAKLFRVLFGLVVLVAPALAIAFLLGSLILSGGKASDAMDTKWGVVVPYPLFMVPTGVLVALGIASIALALGVALTNRTVDELRVRRLIGPTLASAVCSFGLSLTSPEDPTRFNDGFIGTQWIASFYFLAALGVVLLGIVAARARVRSRARSRESARG